MREGWVVVTVPGLVVVSHGSVEYSTEVSTVVYVLVMATTDEVTHSDDLELLGPGETVVGFLVVTLVVTPVDVVRVGTTTVELVKRAVVDDVGIGVTGHTVVEMGTTLVVTMVLVAGQLVVDEHDVMVYVLVL